MSEAYRLKLMQSLKAAPLNDIAAKLRELADRIDRGVVETDSMVLIFDDDNRDELTIIGFGDAEPMAAHWLICLAQRELEGCR